MRLTIMMIPKAELAGNTMPVMDAQSAPSSATYGVPYLHTLTSLRSTYLDYLFNYAS